MPDLGMAREQQRRHDAACVAPLSRLLPTAPCARQAVGDDAADREEEEFGTMRAASTMPSADAESVRCSTANASATGAMALPRNETQPPENSSPKFRRCKREIACRIAGV